MSSKLFSLIGAAAVFAAAFSGYRAAIAQDSNVARTTSLASVPGTAELQRVAYVPAVTTERVTIPAGTVLPLVLESTVASDSSRVEDRVVARTRRPVIMHGVTVIPQGARLTGYVTDAARSGRVKGRARVAFRFTSLTMPTSGERHDIRTSAIARLAPATKKKDALTIGIPAAGGAVIGALAGGKKGAAIGTAVGGGGGTAVVLTTRGREVRMPRGATVVVRLLEPVTVRVAQRASTRVS